MYPKGYYLLESLSSSKSCYFESDEEVRIFRVLVKRYLKPYTELHKLYTSSEGYHVLLRIRSKEVLVKHYVKQRIKKKKDIHELFIREPWRIISEQVRILHSVYVKLVNGIRGRQGVLVQKRYSRYYFEDLEAYESYERLMKEGEEIRGQRMEQYRVKVEWISGVNWGVFRGKGYVLSLVDRAFQRYVVSKLVKSTILSHSPPP